MEDQFSSDGSRLLLIDDSESSTNDSSARSGPLHHRHRHNNNTYGGTDGNDVLSIEDVAIHLERHLELKNHVYGHKVYEQSFIAKDAVTYLVSSKLTRNRRSAVLLIGQLQRKFNLIELTNTTPFHDHFNNNNNNNNNISDNINNNNNKNNNNKKEKVRKSITSKAKKNTTKALRRFRSGDKTKNNNNNSRKNNNIDNMNNEELSSSLKICRSYTQVNFTDGYYFFSFTPLKERFQLETISSTPMEEIAKLFKDNVRSSTHLYRLNRYKNTFIGSNAVDYLVKSKLATSRSDAVRIGRELIDQYCLFDMVKSEKIHLCAWNSNDFADDRFLYRFCKINNRKKPDGEPHDLDQGESKDYTNDNNNIDNSSDHNNIGLDMQTTKTFTKGIGLCTNKYRGKVYTRTFIGSEAVSFIVNSNLAQTRRDAVKIGQKLMTDHRVFISASHSKNHQDEYFEGFKDDNILYRLSPNYFKMRLGTMPNGKDPVGGQAWNQRSSRRNSGKDKESANEDSMTFSFEDFTLENIGEQFMKGVIKKDRRVKFSLIRSTFLGSDAVDFIVNNGFALTRISAVALGQKMARDLQLFEHITDNKQNAKAGLGTCTYLKDDKNFVYKLINERDRDVDKSEDEILNETSDLKTIANDLEAGIKLMSHQSGLRIFPNTFSGKDAVDYLVDQDYAKDRVHAIQIGRLIFQKLKLFTHVTKNERFDDVQNFFYKFTNILERPKLTTLKKIAASRNIFAGLDPEDLLDESERRVNKRESILQKPLTYGNVNKPLWEESVEEEDSETTDCAKPNLMSNDWVSKAERFEKQFASAKDTTNKGTETKILTTHEKTKKWMISFLHIDPRHQMRFFFDEVAQKGTTKIEEGGAIPEVRPLLKFAPNRSSVFTVWRPTSKDAIKKMMSGEAVGKGLDIKGKSAKRGKNSAFVPFLQISQNSHKKQITKVTKEGRIRLFFDTNARRARDIVAERLEVLAYEMVKTVKEASNILYGGYAEKTSMAQKSGLDKATARDAMSAIKNLEMDYPIILYIDDYAPKRYGLEMPVRLFWEAYFEQQDISIKPGTEYDPGRPSQPIFQDANLKSVCAPPQTRDSPKAVIFQKSRSNAPFNPFELLMAYEEHGHVQPVVSDFDCFLVGTKRVSYTAPLAMEQLAVLKWSVESTGNAIESASANNYSSGNNWTTSWIGIINAASEKGFHPEMPRFGYSDPKSYGIMENAVDRLRMTGAVRHGAECFNYTFPQDLDDQFLVIADGLKDDVPWMYVNPDELCTILNQKIDQGYTFPLHPKWILCDAGRWKGLYDKLLSISDNENTNRRNKNRIDSMNIWFPKGSGLRESIDRISKKYPYGFYGKKNFDKNIDDINAETGEFSEKIAKGEETIEEEKIEDNYSNEKTAIA